MHNVSPDQESLTSARYLECGVTNFMAMGLNGGDALAQPETISKWQTALPESSESIIPVEHRNFFLRNK